MSGEQALVTALQEALEAEHAATYVYGVLGARVSTGSDPRAAELLRSAYRAHQARRDELRARIAALGATPVPAAAGYEVRPAGRDAALLLRIARRTEERVAETLGRLVAGTAGEDRRRAVEALTEAALLQLDLGADAEPFPGVPEL
jgi:hypothetical protein